METSIIDYAYDINIINVRLKIKNSLCLPRYMRFYGRTVTDLFKGLK